jgi:hypothetical protein
MRLWIDTSTCGRVGEKEGKKGGGNRWKEMTQQRNEFKIKICNVMLCDVVRFST